MKTMKKALAVLLSALMMLSLCSVAFAENMRELPKADSDALHDGDYWYDVDALLAVLHDTGMSPDLDYQYADATYYLNGSGSTLRIEMQSGGVLNASRSQADYAWYFDGLAPHGGQAEGVRLLPTSPDGLAEGALWFDMDGFVAARAEAGDDQYALDTYPTQKIFANAAGTALRVCNSQYQVLQQLTAGGESDYQFYFDFVKQVGAEEPACPHTDFTYIDSSWYAQPGGWWIDKYQLKYDTDNAVYSDWSTMYYMCSCGDALKIVYSQSGENVTEIHVRGEEGQDVYFQNVHVLPEFVDLPTSEEDLETGAYWFDVEGFISTNASGAGDEDEAEYFRNAVWYLGLSENDTSVIRAYGWMEDETMSAGGYYSTRDYFDYYTWAWCYLQQAGMHEHNFAYIDTSTDWSETGEYWYDAAGLAEELGDTNYSWASYYLCTGRDAIMILVFGSGQPTTETHVFAEEPLYAQFLKTVPEFGDPLPTSDADLEDGEQWFDLAGFVDLFGGTYDEENQASMLEGTGCLSEDGTILRFTWLYHDEYEGQPVSYNRHIDSRAGDPGWYYLRTVGVEPESDFYELPTDPADAQGPDYYWYDKAGFVAACAELYLDPEDEDYEEYLAMYESAVFYLSEDAETLRVNLAGEIIDVDLTDPDLEEEDALAASFLHHFIWLPKYIDDLEPGDLWFDAFKYGHYYDNYHYYLSEDGNTLKIVTDNYIGYHWDESVQGYISDYETFIYTLAEDPDMFDYVRTFTAFGDPLPTADSDDFEDGDYWYDLEGLLAFYTRYYAYTFEYYNTLYEQALADEEAAQAALDAYVAENPNDEEGRHAELQTDLDNAAAYVAEWEEDLAAMRAELDAAFAGIRAGSFRLSEDEYVLRVDYTVTYTDGDETETEEVTEFDTPYKGNEYWYYLRQHGVDPNEGFTQMPFSDSSDLEDGDYWFDLDGFIAYQFPGGDEEGEAAYIRMFDYFISDDGTTLRSVGFGEAIEFTADDEYGAMYFLFVHQHGEEDEDLEGYVLVKDDKTLVEEGDWYIDLAAMFGMDDDMEPAQAAEFEARLNTFRSNYTFYYNETAGKLKAKICATYLSGDDDVVGYVDEVLNNLFKVILVDDFEASCFEEGYTGDLVIERDGENVILKEGEVIGLADHTPGEPVKENDIASTCYSYGGYDMVTYCTVCEEPIGSEHFDYDTLAPHDWSDWEETSPASCTEPGEKYRYCKNEGCEEKEYGEIDALDHDYAAVVTPPTCTERGYTTYTCTRCPDSYVDDYVDATGHTFGAWETVTPATCHTKGLARRTCACGETEEKELEKDLSKHDGSTEVRGAVGATCTAAGYSGDTYCTGCGNKIAIGSSIGAKGHSWGDWNTTKEATDTEAGEQVRECSVCHATETRSIPAKGDNKCKWCGKDHSGSFWQRIVGFFHRILYFFAHLFGLR